MATALEEWEELLTRTSQTTRDPADLIRHAGLNHHLEVALLASPEQDWEFFLAYEKLAGLPIAQIHQEVLTQERKKHPLGYAQGILGLFNMRLLMRHVLADHDLKDEGTALINMQFFLGHKIYYPVLHTYDSLSDAVIDSCGDQYPDLRPYHFGHVQFIWQEDHDHAMAHEAMEELFIRTLGWNFAEIPQRVRQSTFKQPLAYRATLEGLLGAYQKSPSKAVIDFLKRNRHAVVRQYFKDLQVYHFGRCASGTWTDKKGGINFPRARRALHELFVETLHWTKDEIAEHTTAQLIKTTPIRYGAKLGGMLRVVYQDRSREAVTDYLRHVA